MLYYRILQRKIPVGDIVGYSKRKRLFCIFDRDLPYELNIEYNDPHTEITYNPVFGGKTMQWSVTNTYYPTRTLVYRMTEYRCDREIESIDNLKEILNKEENEIERIIMDRYGKHLS